MRVRMKATGDILDLPPSEAWHLINKGSADQVATAADSSNRGETAALKSGEREQVRGKQPGPKRQV